MSEYGPIKVGGGWCRHGIHHSNLCDQCIDESNLAHKLLVTPPCSHCNGTGEGPETINGIAFREWRLEHGYTLREVSKKLGISAPYLSDIERGQRSVSHRIRGAVLKLVDPESGKKKQ